VEDVIEAVEHIALETQHVDPNTTLQPTCRKQVAPPTLPILDLHTRPAPVRIRGAGRRGLPATH
jgi:hypothetical protein